MDLNEVIADTKRAYAEAGEDDPDLSYITQEYLDHLEENAEEVDAPAPEQDIATFAATGNLLFDVTFSGFRYYGRRGGENYTCGGNWAISGTWRQRSIFGRCQNQNALIWRVS